MQNKTKLFKTAICIITTLILIFGTIPCGAVLSDESNTPTFTNLVVFMKFSDEDEFINNTYADTTVRNILDNTYNKSVYNDSFSLRHVCACILTACRLALFAGLDVLFLPVI